MLRTARLVCERFTMDDVDELAQVDREQSVQIWLYGQTYTAAETRARAERRVAFWEERGVGDYVVRTPDGAFIGFAGFFPSELPNAIAVGYALLPPFWGRGFGSELAAVLTRTAVDVGWPDIVATVLASNAASRRVLEKNGFSAAGTLAEEPKTLLYRYGSAKSDV